MQLLYIIKTDTHFKIGISNNPEKRLKTLNTASALPLSIVKTYAPKYLQAFELETKLHKQFQEYRCNGEWFKIECLMLVLENLKKYDVKHQVKVMYDKSLNIKAFPELKEPILYYTPEQTKELLNISGEAALVLMQHYVAIAHQSSPNMEDEHLAKMLNKAPSSIEKLRLALTKAGWFKRIKTTVNGKLHIMYAVGKIAVANYESGNVAILSPKKSSQG